MRDPLQHLHLAIPLIEDVNAAAQVYWETYQTFVPIASPNQRATLMRLMAGGAWLNCASIVIETACPDLTWQVRTRGKSDPALHCAWLFADKMALVSAAMAKRDPGDALLLALVRHAMNQRAATNARTA